MYGANAQFELRKTHSFLELKMGFVVFQRCLYTRIAYSLTNLTSYLFSLLAVASLNLPVHIGY